MPDTHCGLTLKEAKHCTAVHPLFPPCQWDGERIGKKVKPTGWEKKSDRMEKEGKLIMIKEYTEQVVHNAIARHLLTDSQGLPEQQSFSLAISPSLIQSDAIWDISLATLDQLSWLCPLPWSPQFPCWQAVGESWKVLNLEWALLCKN